MRLVLALFLALFVAVASADTEPPPEEIPAGAIVYVMEADCPDGWTEAFDLRGRIVVGVTTNNAPGDTSGDPLDAGEDRLHGHAATASISVPPESVALAGGCCNDAIGGNGTIAVTGTAEPVSSGLPTVALRACRSESP